MRKLILFLIFLLLNSCESSLFAGADVSGYLDSSAENSKFDFISGIDIDKEGNLYIADLGNNVIRKITPEGKVSTFAGTGKKGNKVGKKEDAEFNFPTDIEFDNEENLYIADELNNKVKKISKDGIVSEINFPEKDKLYHPRQIFFSNENKFYIFFEGGFYEILPDLKLENMPITIPYISKISLNKKTNEFYFISSENVTGIYFILKLTKRDINGEIQEITEKYKKSPYPDSELYSIAFDNEGSMYISYSNGCISKTSKDGKFIRNYSTAHFQILFSSNPIRIGKDNTQRMVIDNKRKILYYANLTSIYKINIK